MTIPPRHGTADPMDEPDHLARTTVTWTSYALLGYYGCLVAVLGPVVAFLREEHELTYTQSSLHFSAFAAGLVLAGAFGDRPVRRFGRRATLSTGLVGLGAAALTLAAAPSALGTLPAAALVGSFGGLVLSGSTAALADEHPRLRAAALTEANVVSSALAIAGPLLVGALATTALGWRAGLLAAAATVPAVLLAVRRLPVSRRNQGPTERCAQRPPPGSLPPRYWTFWVLLALVDAVEFSITFWAATYLRDSVGLSGPAATAAVSIFLTGMLVGRLAGARLTRRVGRETRLLVAAMSLAGLGFFIYRFAPNASVAMVGAFVLGLGTATLWPLALALAVGAAPDQSDTAAARSSLAAGLAILTAPFALGWLADRFGIADAHWTVPALLATAALILAAAHMTRPSNQSER